MTQQHTYNIYTVHVTLNNGDLLNDENIHILVEDNENYKKYECSMIHENFKLNFKLIDIYTMINKCFSKQPNYNVVHEEDGNCNINLIFNVLFDSFMAVNFKILLRKKNNNSIKTKLNSVIKNIELLKNENNLLKNEIIKLKLVTDNVEIQIYNVRHSGIPISPNFHFVNIHCDKLTLCDISAFAHNNLNMKKINLLYNLNEITFTTCNFILFSKGYIFHKSEYYHENNKYGYNDENTNIKHIIITYLTHPTYTLSDNRLCLKFSMKWFDIFTNLNKITIPTTEKDENSPCNLKHIEILQKYCDMRDIELCIIFPYVQQPKKTKIFIADVN